MHTKNIIKSILNSLIVSVILVPATSWGLVTARLTYGGLVSKDALSQICEGTACQGQSPSIVPLYGLGADVFVNLPLVPIGFGLRYEKLSLSASSGAFKGDADFSRTAALINYRFIDTIIHAGLVGTFGLNHSGSVKVQNNGADVVNYTGDKFTTYSIGAELEIKPLIVFPLVVGGELGYEYAKWKNSSDAVSGNKKDIDFSGTYVKLFAGLNF